jgi:hypothetical protein
MNLATTRDDDIFGGFDFDALDDDIFGGSCSSASCAQISSVFPVPIPE